MIYVAVDWVLGRWLELGSFIATCVAIFYAHLAYRSSVKSGLQAQAAGLVSLRVQAKSAFTEAQRGYVLFEAACRANRSQWVRYERGLPPLRNPSMFNLWPNAKVAAKALTLLEKLSQSYALIETKTEVELEVLLQEAFIASLQMSELAESLETPPDPPS